MRKDRLKVNTLKVLDVNDIYNNMLTNKELISLSLLNLDHELKILSYSANLFLETRKEEESKGQLDFYRLDSYRYKIKDDQLLSISKSTLKEHGIIL
jgi:hypothetical protein